MKAKNHPTVRRATFIWASQCIWLAVLSVVLTFFAMRDPTNEILALAAFAVVATIVCGLMYWKALKQLRHEYRFEDEDNDEWDQRFEAELLKLGMTPDAAARALGAAADNGDNYGDPKKTARRYAATNPDNE